MSDMPAGAAPLGWDLVHGWTGIALQGDPIYELPPPEGPSTGIGSFEQAIYLKVGLSFLAGLALGFAIKMAVKFALLIGALLVVALLAQQSIGLQEVDLSGIQIQYEGWLGWLSARVGGIFDFMGENLASAASFVAGLALGLRI